MAYEIDGSAFPLVMVRWTGRLMRPEFNGFFDSLTELHHKAAAQKVGLVTVHDARHAERPDADVRAAMAERVKTWSGTSTLVDVVVTDSAALRGVITALGWVMPTLMIRVKAVKDMSAAVEVARGAFQAAGQAVPQNPRWAA